MSHHASLVLSIRSSPSLSTLAHLCCTILYLFSSFCLLYYFPLCSFSLSSQSRLSCLLMVIHLSPLFFNSPLVSLLWRITLCFPFISSTVCGYFLVLLCLITQLELCRKQQLIWSLLFTCTVCVAIIYYMYTTTEN